MELEVYAITEVLFKKNNTKLGMKVSTYLDREKKSQPTINLNKLEITHMPKSRKITCHIDEFEFYT